MHLSFAVDMYIIIAHSFLDYFVIHHMIYATNLLIGKGCNKDVVEGRKLMEKAASLGHEVAIKIINGKKENNNGN